MTTEFKPGLIMAKIQNGTAQLDELVVAHSQTGYLVAQADAEYETRKAEKEWAKAEATLRCKADDPKATAAIIDAQVTIDTYDALQAENEARAKLQKLKMLLSSIVEAINAIKFLGRTGGY